MSGFKANRGASSSDGRGSGKEGGPDFSKSTDVTKIVKEGAGKVKAVSDAVVDQVKNSTRNTTYTVYKSMPNQHLPDTTIVYETDNDTGELLNADTTITNSQ